MRPANKPVKPYSRKEIIDHLYQHFVVEQNPQSRKNNSCFYSETGCAVGCMLTEDDAKVWDNSEATEIYDVYQKLKNEYLEYFKDKDLDFLFDLQCSHDYNFNEFIHKLKELKSENLNALNS